MIDIELLEEDIRHCEEIIAKGGEHEECTRDHRRLLEYMKYVKYVISNSKRIEERLSYHFKSANGKYFLVPKDMPFMKEFLKEVDNLTSLYKINYVDYSLYKEGDKVMVYYPYSNLEGKRNITKGKIISVKKTNIGVTEYIVELENTNGGHISCTDNSILKKII